MPVRGRTDSTLPCSMRTRSRSSRLWRASSHGALGGLDAEYRALLADAFGDRAGEEADAAVEVERRLALAGHQALHHGLDQECRRPVGGPARSRRMPTPLGAVVGPLAHEGAAVDPVDAPVLLLDPQNRDGLVQFDEGQAGARASG